MLLLLSLKRCFRLLNSMRNFFVFLFLCLSLTLHASPEALARRVQAHLLIGDPKNAAQEAKRALQHYPNEALLFEMGIKSFAACGNESEMVALWEAYHEQNRERSLEQDLLEEMCWGILKKGRQAPGLSSQLISIIGSALTRDMRALPFILEGMRHSNAHIRSVSVQLASLYGDHPLRDQLTHLFHRENVLEVRLQVIRAIGKLKLETLLSELVQIVADSKTGAQEKLAAIEAIVNMRECVDREELEVLVNSKRAGLRQLACEVIAHCELKQHADLLPTLFFDGQPDVRAAALKTYGILREPVTETIKRLALRSLDPTVGITAAWVWLINEPEGGERGILRWLEHDQAHVRAVAASAVAASGKYGTSLAKKVLPHTTDSYVKANLALALIGQREGCDQACQILEQFLQNSREKWMLSEKGIFHTLEKSTLAHNPAIPNYPEVVNQTVRLEILNLLAILSSPGAQEALKTFLKEQRWGVTGLAAETLLGEGDENAIELVRELLHDPDREVRSEAALVLATWARDPTALPTLLEVYHQGDRQLKIKILEALGRIGDKEAIPFLIQRLKEPSLLLRMIAASVLIQTLNH